MSANNLDRARAVYLPTREAMLQRAPSVQQFWDQNRELFTEAWKEWDESEKNSALTLDSMLLDARLREADDAAWADPTTTTEAAVRDLWKEVAPGVYQAQFFDPERLSVLRSYMDNAAQAGVPLRPPHGIALNRGGVMLDRRSVGYLAAPSFQAFYRELLDRYMRPVSRLLFPDVMGYDTQTFGFSINYQPDMDTSLQPHTDASAVTLNLNLNLPGEEFTGSALHFHDRIANKTVELSFEPGMAMIHHGSVPHAAQAITSGSRTNFVLWLYGEHGQVPRHVEHPDASASERWTVPSVTSDDFAPF